MAQKYIDRWEQIKTYPHFKRIVQLDPTDRYGYLEEATCYLAIYDARVLGKMDKLEKFTRSSKSDKLVGLGFHHLRECYENNNDSIKLIDIYKFGVDRFANDARLKNRFAWYIYESENDDLYPLGIRLAQEAVEMEPEAANIWDTLAWLYYATGQYDPALVAMKKAVDLRPESEAYAKNLEVMQKNISAKN